VHVIAPTGVAVIELPSEAGTQSVRRVNREMAKSDRRGAWRVVAQNAEFLREKWREIHGSD